MVWPPSAPSQMRLGRDAGNQRACVLLKDKMQVSGPRAIPSREWPGSGHRVSALCCAGRRKIDRCRAPECPEPKVAESGHWAETLVLLQEKMP